MISHVIREIQQYQQTPYCLEAVSFIQETLINAEFWGEEDCYAESLKRESKKRGRAVTDVASNASRSNSSPSLAVPAQKAPGSPLATSSATGSLPSPSSPQHPQERPTLQLAGINQHHISPPSSPRHAPLERSNSSPRIASHVLTPSSLNSAGSMIVPTPKSKLSGTYIHSHLASVSESVYIDELYRIAGAIQGSVSPSTQKTRSASDSGASTNMDIPPLSPRGVRKDPVAIVKKKSSARPRSFTVWFFLYLVYCLIGMIYVLGYTRPSKA